MLPRSQFGCYVGELSPAFQTPDWEALLADLPRALKDSRQLGEPGRHQILVLSACGLEMAIKAFGRQSRWKDRIDRKQGTKAFRSWQIARHLHQAGVGTPEPIASLERWEGSRLVEAYFLSRYASHITSFRDELNRLYTHDPLCSSIMTLMSRVAVAIRAMHDAGVVHLDLGNQNILLRRDGGADWKDVQFIDLNRARIREPLSLRDRARDISRIDLPSDFLRVFKVMYFLDHNPPPEFEQAEDHFRRRFDWHTRTRAWRHPIREYRLRRRNGGESVVPRGRDLWVWDDRSGQAIVTLQSRERKRYYSATNAFHGIMGCLCYLFPVWMAFRKLRAQTFQQELSMNNRFGMTLDPVPETFDAEFALLNDLGPIPVLIRFYHHESRDHWRQRVAWVHHLHREGHPVSIALVQDRRAVLDPGRWEEMVEYVVEALHDKVETIEVGHAINRVKWGIWRFTEYHDLLKPVIAAARRYPHIRWTGPAAIDFEYHYLLGVFWRMPRSLRFYALSHHLYVDRRGAPENRQGPFDTEDKCALALAIATAVPGCDRRLILSEVNWPLSGTGVYSPVNSPYETPGPRKNDPGVDEDTYADYMIRYLALAVCSGMVERIYWWRLVARGFGLVDDTDASSWRQRPAYHMFKVFLRVMRDQTFLHREPTPDPVVVLVFQHPAAGLTYLAWSRQGSAPLPSHLEKLPAHDAFGTPLPAPITLSSRPLYLRKGSALTF